jgi:hypothetical protein
MKHLKTIAFIILLGSITLSLNSCKEKTGDLFITVKNELGEIMVGKTVYLYQSQSDFNDALYIESASTNEYGEAYFFELEPDTYYFDADFTALGVDYYASGSADVIADHETSVTLRP